MDFEFKKLKIPDVVLITPGIFNDERGNFSETYRKSAFVEYGIEDDFVQDNSAHSVKNVLRGLHYQAEPRAMAKLVRVVVGEVLDVAVDIRLGSSTFGRYISVVLSAQNRKQLYIPKGFAHGYLALSEQVIISYKTSSEYSAEHDKGIHYLDPDINIDWGQKELIVSDKDKHQPALKSIL